jgi:protein-disulfide isomerase
MKEKQFHTTLTILSVVQIILLLYIAFSLPSETFVVDMPTVDDTDTVSDVDMAELIGDNAILGDPDAPITIIEWSDYECPFCARFYSDAYQDIKENWIDTGKAKLVFRDFPLSFHANAQKASEAAECAGDQDMYYEMHNLLFEDGMGSGVDTFKSYATELGLDQTEFDDCLDSGKHEAEVKQDMADGMKAGVQGTPGFIIEGQLISGAQPYAVFEQLLESLE